MIICENILWTDVENEHFILWMRVAAFFLILGSWGEDWSWFRASVQLKLVIIFQFTVVWSGKKVALSTDNAFGGKNTFLDVAYWVV